MDLTTIFYREYVGNYPFKTDRAEAITRCTLAWLEESNVSQKEILDMLNKFSDKAIITPHDIPESLWGNSLTRKNQYYCHHELQLNSPTTIYKMDGSCISFPFYQEMKVRYTIYNLLDYFYRKVSKYAILRNPNLDSAQLKHLLSRYSGIEKVQSLDIILFLIDNVAFNNLSVSKPFELEVPRYVNEAIDKAIRIKNERHANGYDKIIWRNYLVEGNKITWMIKR